MRLSSVAASDLLSFADLHLPVPHGLSVIVGPNGSGKTNLGRVIRLVSAAVRAAATNDFADLERQWSLAGRFGSARFEARLGLVFDRPDELSVIENWARAALLTAFDIQNPQTMRQLYDLMPGDLGANHLLTQGQLIVRRDEQLSQPWIVVWQSEDPPGHLDLRHTHLLVPGPMGAMVDRGAARKQPHQILRSAVGGPVPQLGTSNWQPLYAQAFRSFTLADLLSADAFELVARRSNADPEMPALQTLMGDFASLRDTTKGYLHFAQVLDHLLSRSLLVTDNRRVPVATLVDPAKIDTPSGMEDGSGLAAELLSLKNGSAASRAQFRTVQDVFQEITGQLLDVRQQASGTDARELLVTPVVVDVNPGTGQEVDLALELAGAGVEESAWLATLLTGDYHTLVLDEPASNVSAIAQRRLLQVVRQSRRDAQTIMITHSADLVPVNDASDLAVVARLTRHQQATKIHRPQLDQRGFDGLKDLLRHSRLRTLLFAAGAVLVEGPTEVVAFETWLSDLDEPGLPTPEASHVAFLSVDGDTRFPKHARLMQILGIPYAVVADGPAFAPGGALSKMPPPTPTGPTAESFAAETARWEPFRVRTLATEFGIDDRKGRGEIEAFFETVDKPLWEELHDAPGPKDKTLLGYRFASHTPPPDRVVELWRRLRSDLGLVEDSQG